MRESQKDPRSITTRERKQGKLITEKVMYTTKDEHEYFKRTHKIFTKDALKDSTYKRQIPDYLRLMEDPRNQVKLTDVDKTGMVTVISKNQGWITLTPRSMNRRKPLERGGNANDNTKTSILTPSWMQIPTDLSAVPKDDTFKQTVFGNLRAETKRTFLTDKEQPKRSVFAMGGFNRHNVATGDLAEKTLQHPMLTLRPVNLFEWKEDPTR
jgi:hypothetical protein